MSYKAVIGLEIHLQLATKSKLFSTCPAQYHGAAPNTFTDPFTLGLPGALPTLNRRAVDLALMFGLALNCDVVGLTEFHRKNYFYPDSPKNFQLSQYDRPIARDGFLETTAGTVRIKRAHLEDDAGKLTHPTYAPYSLLDLNRAGSPLIEMVTEADLVSAAQAREFLEQVQAIAQALEVSDATPEEGKMRCDVNISLHRQGEPWGTKVEVKNLNSFRSVARAIEYETQRQQRVLLGGGQIRQDTLGWDEGGQKTFVMRTKEGEADYRYFPEPDLPPLEITTEWIERVRAQMPELPKQKKARYMVAGLREQDAQHISHQFELARFFDEALKHLIALTSSTTPATPTPATVPTQKLANWLLSEVQGELGEQTEQAEQTEQTEGKSAKSALQPEHLALLVSLVEEGKVSGRSAKELLPEVMKGHDPRPLISERGLELTSDDDALAELDAAIIEVITADPATVAEVQAGNKKAVNALFGPIMKRLGGKVDPKNVRQRLLMVLSQGE